MKILVINCGSSSLKYQLFDMETENVIAKGIVERIGIEGSMLVQKVEGKDKFILNKPMENHKIAISFVLDTLIDKENGVIKSMDEIAAVGHRVVHGGEKYSESILIDKKVKDSINECSKIAPLHNPPNIVGIEACEELMPSTPMVAVFDTAFHQTMKKDVFLYALPYELYEKHGIRKYGFHGTSHKYVSEEAAKYMGRNISDLRIITCHLGNGASLCAIKNGESIDTTMGFTPLEGVVMGTRSGSIDPAIPLYLMSELKLTIDEVGNILNKKSGVLGISQISSDFRDIETAYKNGDERAILAFNIYHNSIKKQIGAFIAELGGVDAIVFTAGVGENGPITRELILKDLEFFGIKIDKKKNEVRGEFKEISTDDSNVKVFVIPTNEELVIARDTLDLVKNK
ncbi:acetate/propionate family kinase [Clostridium cibarium]|uniref:Acetate kinase n=1 Tax=Clostridium cibarium TaxID=2762247 RepID=A0ABR8PYT5_9CLOT|nr:acetate kinase [Clostridium cibarium]MBD7913333.1 acetate kinase [Clostridium cibarium]